MRASTPLKARPPATGAGAAPSDDRWRELRAGLAATAASWVSTQDGTEEVQERVAQAICAEVIHALWDERTDRDRSWLAPWVTRGLPSPLHLKRLAQEAALALGAASLIEAAFRISGLYTALLPPRVRSSRGAFYTPPVLADRLPDMLPGPEVTGLA